MAKRIGWKLSTENNATTHGQAIDWSFRTWVIGEDFHLTTQLHRQAYRPDGSMVDAYIGTEKSARRDVMTKPPHGLVVVVNKTDSVWSDHSSAYEATTHDPLTRRAHGLCPLVHSRRTDFP